MFNKILLTTLLLFVASTAWSLRVAFPPTLSAPITDDQIATLNAYLKNMWDMQNGRFELDIVTTTKNNAKNGEIWVYNNVGVGTYYLQVKAGNTVRSVALTP